MITSAHGHRKFHKGNVESGVPDAKRDGQSWRRSIREEASGRIREDGGRMDSPACTWQSKEAINHEDNASSPLSELRSLGRRGFHGRDERRRKRGVGEEKIRRSRGGIREATSRRSAQKVNRLPRLLVLLTNFSIPARFPFVPHRMPPCLSLPSSSSSPTRFCN